MAPADRPGDSKDDSDDEIIELTGATTDPATTSFERIIDLRTPGAPYTYPSSPSTDEDDEAEPAPPPSDTGLFGVARGSSHVPSAPPDFD